ncbi:MAG: fibronectin type III domain-containing protein [Candidatus Zixiibacteriota bacterium]
MKRTLCTLLAVTIMLACKAPQPGSETVGRTPYDLKVDVNDQSMSVSWHVRGEGLFSGYNIYISEEPLAKVYPSNDLPQSVRPNNTTPFAGDTNPDDDLEHYDALGLENGIKYFVTVRAIGTDRTLSKPSNEVAAVCGPRGEITLATRYNATNDGYSFEKNQYVRADDLDNDLYFYSREGVDYLASPSRLDGFLRANRLLNLGDVGTLIDAAAMVEDKNIAVIEDRLSIKQGDWLYIVTPETRHALVHVLSFSGADQQRTVQLYFAYSTLPGVPFF